MADILVVEDDPTVNELVRLHLEAAGHRVGTAVDGLAGLERVRATPPDLVVSDVRMPRLDGFAMLEALRGDARTALVPVVFLSSLEDRQSFRRGMELGADDFLIKPVRGEELVRAVESRLTRTRVLKQHLPAAVTATLMVISVRNAIAMAAGLSATARRETLQDFGARLAEPIVAERGRVLQQSAFELVAMFDAGAAQDDARRALRAALLALLAAHRFRGTLELRASRRGACATSIGIGLDRGEIAFAAEDGGGPPRPIGPTLERARAIEPAIGRLGWGVSATSAVLRADATNATSIVLGARAAVASTEIVEVLGFAATAGEPLADAVREARVANAAFAGDAFDLHGRARVLEPVRSIVDSIPGYAIDRRISGGGMSRVYLARELASDVQCVLKIVTIDVDDPDALQRFIQEYALIAQIRHPNVARIQAQGFAPGSAYIAMEYLAGGDLRARIAAGGKPGEAVGLAIQITLALTALHDKGIVHRDLKPENLMFRAEGTLVLADFGIAKQLSTHLTRTRAGEVFGTPFYMSPEQARGKPVDPRSDFYSLGAILFELLAGEKPFTAASAAALAYQHVHSDIPLLPGRLWRYQPVVDRLLAKRPEERFESAVAVLAALRELQANEARTLEEGQGVAR